MHAQPWTTDMMLIPPPRRRDLIEEQLDGERILCDPRNGSGHRLNETAYAVWRECDGERTTREIAQHLTRVYEVELETALDYVEQLVAFFGQSKLLEAPGVT